MRVLVANTAALYAKTFITTCLAIASTRLTLDALGVVDFGLYAVVAGVMVLLSFIVGALASSAQRHLALELGAADKQRVAEVFRSILLVHFVLFAVIVLVGEVVGVPLVRLLLNIPPKRLEAAMWVYQFAVAAAAAYVLVVPFEALLTAHESFLRIAALGLFQAFALFFVAWGLNWYSGDRLILYAALTCLASWIMALVYALYCRHLFPEVFTRHVPSSSRESVRALLGFTTWNLLGALSVVSRSQGVAIVQNHYFGVITNAALGVAQQIANASTQLTSILMQTIAPKLVKMEGAGRREEAVGAAVKVCAIAFAVAATWSIPLMLEVPFILRSWLGEPPVYADVFCRLMLGLYLVDQLSAGLSMSIQAIGKIARYQIFSSIIHLSTIPLALVLISAGVGPSAAVGASLLTAALNAFIRPYLFGLITEFSYRIWLIKVVLPAIAIAAAITGVHWLTTLLLGTGSVRLMTSIGISLLFGGGFLLAQYRSREYSVGVTNVANRI